MKYYRYFLLLLSVAMLSGCAIFHRSPPPPMAPLYSFQPSLAIKQQWAVNTGNGTSGQYLKLNPALNENILFVPSFSGDITGINILTGQKVWQLNTKNHLTSGLAVGNGMLVVGTHDGTVLAYQIANRNLSWWTPVSNEVLATPVISQNQVVVKSADDHLYSLDLATGKTNWSYNEPLPELILRGGSSPVVAGKQVFAGFADGQLGAFSADGNPIWKQTIAEGEGATFIQRMVDIDDNLIVQNGIAYVATYQGVVAAVELQSGRILWQDKVSSYSGIAVDQDNVYVADADSYVWAFNKRNGMVVWRSNKLFGRGITGPAVIGNAVVVGDAEGYVHWLSKQDGNLLARAAVDSNGIIATPIVSGNSVYVYANSGRLVRFNVQ